VCVRFVREMEHDGSSVTLIFYRVGDKWWKEPILNIIAAAAQMSTLTHVEIAIGGPSRRPPLASCASGPRVCACQRRPGPTE